MWFALHGSSLFSYTEQGSVQPKETFQLKGAAVVQPPERKLAIDIMNGDKVIVSLVATSKDELESWVATLNDATSLDECDAPLKEKKKKNQISVGMRVGKAVGGKVATSGVGKGVVKNVVNEETKLLIVSLKKIIAKVESRKVAEEIEDNLMRIITKSFFLEKAKKITLDEFLEADAPLREAFENLVEMRDYRHRMRPETVKQRLNVVHERLGNVEKIITAMLVDHMKVQDFMYFLKIFF
jgi:hypothetical protein